MLGVILPQPNLRARNPITHSATPIKARSGTRRSRPRQLRHHDPGGAVSNSERNFAHSVLMLRTDGSFFLFHGRPRGRWPGFTGMAPFRRAAAALAALLFSNMPGFYQAEPCVWQVGEAKWHPQPSLKGLLWAAWGGAQKSF